MKAAGAALAPLVLWASTLAAAAQGCGEHEVVAGDTLARIAREAPGAPDPQAIYVLNKDRLKSADHIEVGQVLRLPCPPEAEAPARAPEDPPSETAEAAAPDPTDDPATPDAETPEPAGGDPEAPAERAEAPAAAALPSPPPTPPDPEAGPIRVAWGGDAAALPASDRARARLEAALARASGRAVEIEAGEGDARAEIAPGAGADLAFAWIAPDCAALARLDAASAEICARYDLSRPLASVALAWFVRAGDAARGPADLAGRRICRPEGRSVADLAALGLAPPRAVRAAPATAAECLRMVAAGEADAAALFAEDALFADLAAGLRRFAPEGAPEALSLVALAHPANPRGRAAIETLDRGLAALEGEE
ncbi:LysM peptidoglycan-binding domain-containing protein [Albimonas sp. CAU 1670]|uniref:LysM peptidoglycan-binding domain-containing protein n=1 Tax=Albimonas sp. CAU 1670 TaxID=3032599 RepID=UPI0023DC31EB|nr:LysM peptidoglycan-binding domain-containing protein [Albimonas sp. CAU 1670]MDF2235176.1 LysM peptidoglycan-binding domain-containing protein [Albimonas sp. CAU 1670]